MNRKLFEQKFTLNTSPDVERGLGNTPTPSPEVDAVGREAARKRLAESLVSELVAVKVHVARQENEHKATGDVYKITCSIQIPSLLDTKSVRSMPEYIAFKAFADETKGADLRIEHFKGMPSVIFSFMLPAPEYPAERFIEDLKPVVF